MDFEYNEETEYFRKLTGRQLTINDESIIYLKKIREIQRMIDKIDSNMKIGIYGVGEHTDYLFKCIDFHDKNILFLIDKRSINAYGIYECKRPNEENLTKLDAIIISSFGSQNNIKQLLINMKLKAKIICLYDENDTLPFYKHSVPLFKDKTSKNFDLNTCLFKLDKEIDNIKNNTDYYLHYRVMKKSPQCYTSVKSINEFPQVGIIVQGPIKYEDDFTYETLKYYCSIYPKSKIILSTWKGEENHEKFFKFKELNIEILLNDKPELLSKWDSVTTINFQLRSTYNALKRLRELKINFALKTRTDMRINSIHVIETLTNFNNKFPSVSHKQKNRITILPSLYTYNVPDFVMYGNVDDMLLYWKFPMDINFMKEQMNKGYGCPEAILSRRYIQHIYKDGNSREEFCFALKKYFIVMDMDDFNIYWGKYQYGTLTKCYYTPDEFISAYDWLFLDD